MKKRNNKLLILSIILLTAISCKKSNESIPDIGINDGKFPFETIFKSTSYDVNINADAHELLNSYIGIYTGSIGVVSDKFKITNSQSFIWLLKPVTNANWKLSEAKEILLDLNFGSEEPGSFGGSKNRASFMLDQVLLPQEIAGSMKIEPLQNSLNSINNPLKVNVEYWRTKTVFALVQQPKDENKKILEYPKQSVAGVLLETKSLTFNAENFSLSNAPATVTKSTGTVDLNSWLDESVKKSDGDILLTSFEGSTAIKEKHLLDLSVVTPGETITIIAHKHYANGYFEVSKAVVVN